MRIILSSLSLPFPEPGRFQLHNRDLEHFLDIFSSGKKLPNLKEIFKLVLQRYFDRCQALNDVLWVRSWKSWRDFCPNHECNWWRVVSLGVGFNSQMRRYGERRRINSAPSCWSLFLSGPLTLLDFPQTSLWHRTLALRSRAVIH